jgi:hypothetical protein
MGSTFSDLKTTHEVSIPTFSNIAGHNTGDSQSGFAGKED